MEEYISLKVELRGRRENSILDLEGLEYTEAENRIFGFINMVFRGERFVNLRIEGDDGKAKIIREFERTNYAEARERIIEFLKFIYKVEESLPEVEESWLTQYDIENLSQKDKLLLLLKHNHPNEWVRSQHLKEEYEIIYGEKINLSSVSTYLARFYESGLADRRGSRAQREYKYRASTPMAEL